MKLCSKCKIPKELKEFQPRPERNNRPQSYCKECGRKMSRNWKAHNPERTRELSRKSATEFFKKHPDRVRQNARASVKRRLKTDPEYKLLHNLRRRLNKVLNGAGKSKKTKELLGCSPAELKKYLERLFLPGMNWLNYGLWHVDHKKPCVLFNMTDPQEQAACFHFSNLQPLWAKDNQRKGVSFPG